MGAYNLLLVVTLLGLCAWCTMGMRGKSRGVGLLGNFLRKGLSEYRVPDIKYRYLIGVCAHGEKMFYM
jgi:hypothetical protein